MIYAGSKSNPFWENACDPEVYNEDHVVVPSACVRLGVCMSSIFCLLLSGFSALLWSDMIQHRNAVYSQSLQRQPLYTSANKVMFCAFICLMERLPKN